MRIEFWDPIIEVEPFRVKPQTAYWVRKTIHSIGVSLYAYDDHCYVCLTFARGNRLEHREEIMELFPESEYPYKYQDSPKFASIIFPVLDKGQRNRDDWDEVRNELVRVGSEIYYKVESPR